MKRKKPDMVMAFETYITYRVVCGGDDCDVEATCTLRVRRPSTVVISEYNVHLMYSPVHYRSLLQNGPVAQNPIIDQLKKIK